ncbi:hypothetical protein N7533_011073 [Penicillium manginii]|jgi:hypothetical protein|uniref:uncharacterized protein n=1 Tax=Penicillium manginii TaxID=203109 RepID=UPI002547EFC6|nr:uncharacterized protein N7533_011073 [Penicillium manginii]KAJ5741664.1 hypothetical protein N7533_011073 [Penicillium manginii]
MDPITQAVLPDAASALIEVINLNQPTSRSLYRKLKLSLAPFLAEIKSPGVVQALLHKKLFQVALQRVASSLNELLSAEYVKTQYLGILEKDASKRSSGFSFLRGVWSPGDEEPPPGKIIKSLLLCAHPILHIFHHLIQRCDTREIDLKQLLGRETSQIKNLIARVKHWNSIVDEMYDDSDSEASATEAPDPPSLELIFSKEDSVPYSSRSLYEILHQNWPCGSDAHNHNGRLGLCFEAKFCLDPRWASTSHINDNFLMLLNGPDIRQECRVCISTSG